MLRIFIVILIVCLAWWFLFKFNRAQEDQRQQLLMKFLLYAAAAGLILLVVTGRAPWFFAVIGAIMPWIQRILALKKAWQFFKPKSVQAEGINDTSVIASDFVRLEFDHVSRSIKGHLLRGEYAGHELAGLSDQQLIDLLQDGHLDSDTKNLLMVYLDQRSGKAWRDDLDLSFQASQFSGDVKMTKAEALQLLGLDSGANDQAIIQAHKKLIQKVHPDRGGSQYLAMKINQAKTVLLEET